MDAAPMTGDLGPLDYSLALHGRHEAATTVDERKRRGQIFTPPGVCRFMAGLFSRIPDDFRLLDAGAGTGSLTAAVCERVLALRSPRRLEVHLYESDPELAPLIEECMGRCGAALRAGGHEFEYRLHVADFILETAGRPAQRTLFDDAGTPGGFDAAIMNPPYFKIGADSPHALAMAEVLQSHTNIYNLFMARAAELLNPGGELVAITPRSFCNGLYFRDFRRWFFSRMALEHVHLFECRRSTFENVLQESIITRTRRSRRPSPRVSVTTSLGRDIPEGLEGRPVARERVLDDSAGDMVVRIPTSAEEVQLLDAVEAWPGRFADEGLRISTGPVVTFRTEEFLLPALNGKDTAPLLTPHNIRAFETTWPLEVRGKPTAFRVCPESLKHLVETRNYVLLRRFSAKEERRRLTASWFLHSAEARPYLALENHLNYVYHAERELSVEEVCGLTALFNSALLDKYFRIQSGNTQVNATEVRVMKFPDLGRVSAIGSRIRRLRVYPPEEVEEIVLEELGIDGPLARYLTGSAT